MPDEFDEFVKRIEADADRNLRPYKLKLLLLALLGYAYIFFVLATLLALVGLLLWAIISGKGLNTIVIKTEIVLLILVSIIARAMWVKVPAPEGVELAKEQAPVLFETVDEIRRAIDGPVVHKILIGGEFTAYVASVPPLGLLGWPRHYLVIGLPMMHAMPAEEFRAALAHEMGHLAGAHGRFSSWIYRIRITWQRLIWSLASGRPGVSVLFYRFFKWYMSFFGDWREKAKNGGRKTMKISMPPSENCALNLRAADGSLTARQLCCRKNTDSTRSNRRRFLPGASDGVARKICFRRLLITGQLLHREGRRDYGA